MNKIIETVSAVIDMSIEGHWEQLDPLGGTYFIYTLLFMRTQR